MTQGIFPLIPLSHKGSREEWERGCVCVRGWGAVSPPEEAGSYMALLLPRLCCKVRCTEARGGEGVGFLQDRVEANTLI